MGKGTVSISLTWVPGRHGHPPDQQPVLLQALPRAIRHTKLRPRLGLPHPARGQDHEPACPVKAGSTPVQVQPLSLGSQDHGHGALGIPDGQPGFVHLDPQRQVCLGSGARPEATACTSCHRWRCPPRSPAGPGGEAPENRRCAHTGRPSIQGRSADASGRSRRAAGAMRCRGRPCTASTGRATAPERPDGGDGCRCTARCRLRNGGKLPDHRATPVGVRDRQEPGPKSTTKGPVGFGRTKPSAGAPSSLARPGTNLNEIETVPVGGRRPHQPYALIGSSRGLP